MIAVKYPEPDFKTRMENGRRYVFDKIRKTWLLLTEEEWVRQNFINYLVNELHYPSAFIALEKEIQLHDLKKRFDILVYDINHQPWMMVECKGADVPLNEHVLQQALRYNLSVPVKFIVITNGKGTVAWEKTGNDLKMADRMPRFGVNS
jgi:hypothetical protein